VSFDAYEVNVDFTTLAADEFHRLGEAAGSECLMQEDTDSASAITAPLP
jgi:hypothetical protein